MISRRNFLKGAIAAIGACSVSKVFNVTQAAGAAIRERSLKMYNIHSGERLHTTYYSEEGYGRSELERIYYLLRCHYTNTIKPISLEVIDLLYDIKEATGFDGEISIISGYRSPEYNAHLKEIGRHVVSGSLHIDGLAVDFAMPGIHNEKLARAAKAFSVGGVGTYPDFVHIDSGRVRYW
jgi:uncharacterized protein YcbK (DUF882 family)